MAWIKQRKRTDGGTSVRVEWRLGGGRGGALQVETFAAGTDAQNLARAEGFKTMVEAAGGQWPQGWVKGLGFVRPDSGEPSGPPPAFLSLAEEYIRQIVDISPGQRRRYLLQAGVLAWIEIRGARIFDQPVHLITERDIKAWLIDWDRAMKTKANYHGLLYGVFGYAVEQGHLPTNPCARTAPKRSRVRQAQAELRFLTESEFAAAADHAGPRAELLRFAVGTGLRFGELTALGCSDIDLEKETVRVNKAWKRDGEAGATETPAWLKKTLQPKHRIRQYHLGRPKTPRSRRTISIAPAVIELVGPLVEGRAADDFVFVSPTGRPWHQTDFYSVVWKPLMACLSAQGIAPFRFHDLRHPRRLAGRRQCSAAAHPGTVGARVDHHHDRHLRPPDAGGRRADRGDRADRTHRSRGAARRTAGSSGGRLIGVR